MATIARHLLCESEAKQIMRRYSCKQRLMGCAEEDCQQQTSCGTYFFVFHAHCISQLAAAQPLRQNLALALFRSCCLVIVFRDNAADVQKVVVIRRAWSISI